MPKTVIDTKKGLIVGYTDIQAKIDLSSFRRIPWENDIPFFLVILADRS
jgi:glutamine synthetase